MHITPEAGWRPQGACRSEDGVTTGEPGWVFPTLARSYGLCDVRGVTLTRVADGLLFPGLWELLLVRVLILPDWSGNSFGALSPTEEAAEPIQRE